MRQDKQPKRSSATEIDKSWFVATPPVSANRTERAIVKHPPTLDESTSWADHDQEPERWDGMS